MSALTNTSPRPNSVLPSASTLWTLANVVCALFTTPASVSGVAINVFVLGGLGKLKQHDLFRLQ